METCQVLHFSQLGDLPEIKCWERNLRLIIHKVLGFGPGTWLYLITWEWDRAGIEKAERRKE
jgi:hypothetical protein